VSVPTSATAGTSYTFRLTVTNANGATSTAEMHVAVHDVSFETFLTMQTPQIPAGAVVKPIAFNSEGMWIGDLLANYVSGSTANLFGPDGGYIKQEAIGGYAEGLSFANGKLIVANWGTANAASIQSLDPTSGTVTTIATGSFGTSDNAIMDKSGNIFLSNNNGNTVYRYDAITKKTAPFVSYGAANVTPNGLAFGPEADCIYLGTQGAVLRVRINDDGTAGATDNAASGLMANGQVCAVTGISFDTGMNMWIGCPGSGHTLFVGPYNANGPAKIARTFQNPTDASASWFMDTTFGNAAFGETNLYWSNFSRTIERFNVGLKGTTSPARMPE
jgi:hypothetical protein